MARTQAFTAELASLLLGMEVAGIGNSAGTLSTTTVRSGLRALRVAGLVSGQTVGVRVHFAAVAGNGPFYPRAYLRVATPPSAENTIIELNDTSDFATPIVRVTLDNSRVLRLYDEDAQITGTTTLSADTWHRIELLFDRTPAAGSQIVRAYVDGIEFAGAATRDLSAGVFVLGFGGNLLLESQTAGEWFFDDVAINNGSGSSQNSFPGEGEEIMLRPSEAGDNADWTRGGTDSGANWSQVEELPPNDVTDYNQSNTAAQIDDYNLEATSAELASDDVINCVQVGVRVAVSSATGSDPDIVLRIKASSGGTVEESAALDVSNVNWRTNNSTDLLYLLTLYDLPGASTAGYTKADLDTTQIGVREAVTDTHFALISAMWLLVDHKPAPAAKAPPPFQQHTLRQWRTN